MTNQTEMDQLIIDPWKQINRERQQMHLALKYLKHYLRQAEMSTASGSISAEFCKLCAKVPAGMVPEMYRSMCPCKVVPNFITEQEVRLRQPIRRNKADRPEPLPNYEESGAL